LRIVIFGGTGFIGSAIAERWSRSGLATEIVLVDIVSPRNPLPPGVRFVETDVRKKIGSELTKLEPDWIINLAAVHREPGHKASEYYETNILGAQNICQYASLVECKRILFTSSISVYGASPNGASEESPTVPNTPYGGSKLGAELIHRLWLSEQNGRRLVIMRPGVIFGPGDPGNILRMYKAIKAGFFVLPGDPQVRKSYAYIDSLIDGFQFLMARDDALVTANFAQPGAETIKELSEIMSSAAGRVPRVVKVPIAPLVMVSHLMQWVTNGKSPIHPVRVRKVSKPTYVEPRELIELGFKFNYPMKVALEVWRTNSPDDFR
jgi:GlcNAc-P-P-Und epimerase